MKRAWVLLLYAFFLVMVTGSAALADEYDQTSTDELEAANWEGMTGEDMGRSGGGIVGNSGRVLKYCKTETDLTDDDYTSVEFLSDPVVEDSLEEFKEYYRDAYEGSEVESDPDTDYAMVCLAPDSGDEKDFCVTRNFNIHSRDSGFTGKEKKDQCWDSAGEPSQSGTEGVLDFLEDPLGSIAGSALGQFAQSLGQGVRWFFAMLLYWWITIPHSDLEKAPAGALWPSMMGIGMLVGTLLLIGQGIKLMISRKPGIIVSTLKGLAVFVATCACGVTVLASAGHAAESMTVGFLQLGKDLSEQGCSEYQANVPQEDDLELDYPPLEAAADNTDETLNEYGAATGKEAETEQSEADEVAELGRAFGNCASAAFFAHVPYLGFLVLLYVVAFIMTFIQAVMLVVREAGLPLMALLLPIAAAGQIGGTASKRWLPGLLAMTATLLLYKPVMAIIFAVGFTQATLSDQVIDILGGMVMLLFGVIVPSLMMKAFKPLMANIVEEGVSAGTVMNNALMASQVSSTISNFAQKQAQSRAAQAARKQAASQAAQAGGGLAITATKEAATTAAAAGAGPVGIAARALQWVGQGFKKAGSFLLGKDAGTEAGEAARRAAGRHTHPSATGHPVGTDGREPAGGLRIREHARDDVVPTPPPPVPTDLHPLPGEDVRPPFPEPSPPAPPPRGEAPTFDDSDVLGTPPGASRHQLDLPPIRPDDRDQEDRP